jgi:hypothetical protein
MLPMWAGAVMFGTGLVAWLMGFTFVLPVHGKQLGKLFRGCSRSIDDWKAPVLLKGRWGRMVSSRYPWDAIEPSSNSLVMPLNRRWSQHPSK